MYNQPNESLEEANLYQYDILLCEPLHDTTGHIKNLLQEIPHHLQKESKLLFNKIVDATLGKDAKRGCDYRELLVMLCLNLREQLPEEPYNIMFTLCEIVEILYSLENKRTQT